MKRGIVDAVQLRRTSKIEEVLVYDRHNRLPIYIIAGRDWLFMGVEEQQKKRFSANLTIYI